MRSIYFTKAGGPEVIEVREAPDPTPKDGEVRIQVKAAGLNFAEIMARMGLYPGAPPFPVVVGYESAGVVDQVGSGVESHKVGDRVIALTNFGGHSSAVCVKADQALPMPDAMTFEEGAAIPVNYLTAYHMLFRVAFVQPGESVLIHMAAGGVGIAVLQLCKTVENVTVFGTSSASKHDVIRKEGCTHPIDYRTKDYVAEIRRIANGRGVDIVLDPLGGRDVKKGYKLLNPAGRLVAFGFANMTTGERRDYLNIVKQITGVPLFTPMGLMEANKSVAGVHMGRLWGEKGLLKSEMVALLKFYGEGKIKPYIDSVHPFDKAAEAHHRITSRQNVGKVILAP